MPVPWMFGYFEDSDATLFTGGMPTTSSVSRTNTPASRKVGKKSSIDY